MEIICRDGWGRMVFLSGERYEGEWQVLHFRAGHTRQTVATMRQCFTAYKCCLLLCRYKLYSSLWQLQKGLNALSRGRTVVVAMLKDCRVPSYARITGFESPPPSKILVIIKLNPEKIAFSSVKYKWRKIILKFILCQIFREERGVA